MQAGQIVTTGHLPRLHASFLPNRRDYQEARHLAAAHRSASALAAFFSLSEFWQNATRKWWFVQAVRLA